jgi:hypothetical protein
VSDVRRLSALEDENAKLKKLLAEAMLDNTILKDIASKKMVTPAHKREAVAHLRSEFEVSERRRTVLGVDGARCVIAAGQQTTTRSAFGCAPWCIEKCDDEPRRRLRSATKRSGSTSQRSSRPTAPSSPA